MNELLNDANMRSSLHLAKLIEKTLKTINADMLRLQFIIPQTDELKEKVEVLHKRY